ncbi:MAG: hypothetical protein CL940_08670 [Deltaproteobacteria bacterium]|nr:hypothetical protein [Deltaproteobacteria bacterium]
MDRRTFIKRVAGVTLGTCALGSASPAMGFGADSKIRIHVLTAGERPEGALSGAQVLATELRYRTSIDMVEQPLALGALDPRFSDQAFAVLTGSGSFSFSDQERQVIARWISLGGFLWIDNGGKEASSVAFDRSARRELAAMFPGQSLHRVSADHVLFRTFYRLDYPAGRAIHRPYVEGLSIGPRIAVVLNHNDLLGALAKAPDGSWASTPEPGGESQREMAMRFGVNLGMYALCQHYKDDQVHLDYLLHRRKWRIQPSENP